MNSKFEALLKDLGLSEDIVIKKVEFETGEDPIATTSVQQIFVR